MFTVDGRNPAPVDIVNISLFTGIHTSQVVVWDFFHQQYYCLGFRFRVSVGEAVGAIASVIEASGKIY